MEEYRYPQVPAVENPHSSSDAGWITHRNRQALLVALGHNQQTDQATNQHQWIRRNEMNALRNGCGTRNDRLRPGFWGPLLTSNSEFERSKQSYVMSLAEHARSAVMEFHMQHCAFVDANLVEGSESYLYIRYTRMHNVTAKNCLICIPSFHHDTWESQKLEI